ncbi:Hypothetical protein LOCK908_1098 [Lacticaseibacillus rhamnosus LOCK908]|nr:Hypothetical protein LOCK908_1098 [Lacticaseibacillus rhamnosus LOCK908]
MLALSVGATSQRILNKSAMGVEPHVAGVMDRSSILLTSTYHYH